MRKILALLAALICTISFSFADTYTGTCGTNLQWSLDTETGVLDITGSGAMRNYSSAPWYSYRSYITSVNVSNSVTSIGRYAFHECTNLTSITIGNSVTSIGESAFSGSGLTSITIPNSVTSIGELAFYWCSNLTSITIPNSVTSIGKLAFSGSGLTSITIGSSVTSIGERAFDCASLRSVIWNATNYPSPTSQTYSPFYCVSRYITSITFGNSVQTIPAYLCNEMSNLTSIEIPSSVTSIGERAFYGCTNLTSITIGNSVTSIGESAFAGSGLTSITIPNSVTEIGKKAFSGCSNLSSVTIPNSVTSIGLGAFGFCLGLTSIVVDYGNPVYDSRNDCNAIIEIATSSLIVGCVNTTFPSSVTTIGTGAFLGCYSLTSFTIPNSITTIEGSAFYFCSNLSSITIPNSVTTIGKYAFAYCSLYEIYAEATTPPLADPEAFYYAGSNATKVYVPVGTTSAYQSAEGWSDFTNFIEWVTYTVTVGSADETMGVATGGAEDINTQTEITISATSKPGYHFTQWSDGNTSNPRTIIVTQDSSFIAEFAPNQYTLALAVNNEDWGVVSGAGSYDYMATVICTATPISGYHFTQWSDGNSDNPRTIVLTQDTALTAEFALNQCTLTLTVNNEDWGVVSGAGSYDSKTLVTCTATPISGYEFVRWSDGSTYNPYSFIIKQDTELQAIFQAVQSAVTDVEAAPSAQKFLRDGQILFRRGEHLYDATGRLID